MTMAANDGVGLKSEQFTTRIPICLGLMPENDSRAIKYCLGRGDRMYMNQ